MIKSSYPNATTETALNGKIALEKVIESDSQGKPFELILMDINMPEMDGFESSSLISASYREGKIKKKPMIAAITAYTSDEMKRRATQNGMEKFLTKPAQG